MYNFKPVWNIKMPKVFFWMGPDMLCAHFASLFAPLNNSNRLTLNC